MATPESACDTGSSLASVVASVAELSSKFLCLEHMVRDMSSKHAIGANAQWDIQRPDGEESVSNLVCSGAVSETYLSGGNLSESSETVFGSFM